MPLSLEPTAGADDANSYASLEEALEYASYRVGGDAFLELDEADQVRALFTATAEIDALEDEPGFLGSRSDEEQALAFPRDGDDELPAKLVRATIELAISYAPAFADDYTGDPLNDAIGNGNIKRDKVGPVEVEFFESQAPGASTLERLPAAVQRLLAGFIVSSAATWGSAAVSRGS